MCFSATASFAAGAAIGATGLATLPFVRDRRQITFAALPLVFAFHQMIEGVIWTQLEESGGMAIRTIAVQIWLFVAWLVFPAAMPLLVWRFEDDVRRQRIMLGLAGVGTMIGGYLAIASVLLPVTVQVNQHHLEYAIPVHPGWFLAVPYVAATCLPLLLSSHRFVAVFGAALFVSMGGTWAMDAKEFSSVWCFFAAILSTGLFVHYASLRRRTMPAPVPAA